MQSDLTQRWRKWMYVEVWDGSKPHWPADVEIDFGESEVAGDWKLFCAFSYVWVDVYANIMEYALCLSQVKEKPWVY